MAKRGAAIIEARGASSAASAASATIDHARTWVEGTADGDWVSMAVRSDGSYGVQEGLMSSFPVTITDGRWSIVQGLEIDDFSRGRIEVSHPDRLQSRQSLRKQLDGLARELEQSPAVASLDAFEQQAMELLLGRKARRAFDLDREPQDVRDRYGKHLWCQQALLARRLVEAGVSFVTIDLSYHPASGTWDNHGDNIPPYGGISKGLGPLLPLFDHLLTTLVSDLQERGLLDEVLVVSMGEFGRTPVMGTQGSTDGRNHWTSVMSMALAGGGLRHGQVIGSSEADGGHIKDRPVTPADLAATFYQHMGVPLDTVYYDANQRPRAIVDNGRPLEELF